MSPLQIVPGLVSHLQADGRRDHVNGTMAHEMPLTLRLRQDNEPATLRPRTTAGLTAVTPQLCDTLSGPRDVGVEGGLTWRNSPLIQRPVPCCFVLCTFVEVAGDDDRAKLHAQVADEQQKLDANRPLVELVVDVNIQDER